MAFISIVPDPGRAVDLTPFEQLFLADGKLGKSVSGIYALLRDGVHVAKPLFEREMDRAMGTVISEQDCQTVYYYTGTTTLSSRLQERNYKIIAHWYRRPFSIHRKFPQVPYTCWRCTESMGKYLHIW